jgi:hypothetical protein
MLTSKRARTLSDEGLKLYGMMGSHPTKKGIRRLLFSCFWSDYDQRLKDVGERMRESTKSLYKQMDDSGFDKRMDAGIQHLIRLILTHDNKKVKMCHIRQNYHFYLDLMRKAFEEGDHQTAMMCWIALDHTSVTRLIKKRAKREDEIRKLLVDAYGLPKTCFVKHLKTVAETGYDTEMLPSMIAVSIFNKRDAAYQKTLDQLGEQNGYTNHYRQYLNEVMDMYKILNYRNDWIIPLYEQEQMSNKDLFELSYKIKSFKSKGAGKSLKRVDNVIRFKNKLKGKWKSSKMKTATIKIAKEQGEEISFKNPVCGKKIHTAGSFIKNKYIVNQDN